MTANVTATDTWPPMKTVLRQTASSVINFELFFLSTNVLSHTTYSLDICAVLALWKCIPETIRLNLFWDIRSAHSTFRITKLHLVATMDSHLVPNICHDALKTSTRKLFSPFQTLPSPMYFAVHNGCEKPGQHSRYS